MVLAEMATKRGQPCAWQMAGRNRATYCWSRITSAGCQLAAAGRSRGRTVVAEQGELSFAGLLRQLRAEARLTQEELAEAAQLSPRSVSDLERGINRTAHKDTALLLADALRLAEPVRASFVAAARGRGSAADVLAARNSAAPGAFAASATQALPRDIVSFTGRQAELARLIDTMDAQAANGGVVGIHAIDGMAGIGKTTFAVHAAHRLAAAFPDGQFFLPLHAHTPGQRPVDPVDALASLLLTAGVPAAQIPPGLDPRAGRWRAHVAGKKILLLLDDAASHEQIRPLLPGTASSLVLITSRRRLAALEDTTVVSLDVLPAGEAAELLARLADRPELASGTDPAGEITWLCGYLPLAIGMLASQLRHHPAWTGTELAAKLLAASDRLAIMRAENLSVAAAFDLSYQDLTAGPQRLFRRLGLVPGPSFDAHAAAALDDTSLDITRRHLDELYDHHLLAEPTPGRYHLHDLLREHAHALAAADELSDCTAATRRLLDYYLHTVVAASRHIAMVSPPGLSDRTAGESLLSCEPPMSLPTLSDPRQAATWMETERPNLHAAVGYAAANEQPLHAIAIPSAMSSFLGTRGHWDQAATLHQTALAAARHAGDRSGQAGALNQLGILDHLVGDYPAAAESQRRALALFGEAGDRPGQAYALIHLGIVQRLTGDYQAAAASQEQALALIGEAADQPGQANAFNQLGLAQQLSGDYRAASTSLHQALAIYRGIGHAFGQADALNNLGIVQRLTGAHQAAATSHQQALALFRAIDNQPGQAWALNDLGMVQQLTGEYAAAAASHRQALELYRGFGDQLGQAEALNNLGELSTRTATRPETRSRHRRALKIARDINAPLEEARALEGIGRSYLQEGNGEEGLTWLRQALTIYQRIGAPAARRVKETLCNPELPESGERPLCTGSWPRHQVAGPVHISGSECVLPALRSHLA